jgi:hypothetical protein
MAKRKKAVKKKAKTTGLKKVDMKKRKKKTKKVLDPLRQYSLHEKKLRIMDEVSVMPCTLFGRDAQGYRYAYTQASEVYKCYRMKCADYGLTIRRVSGMLMDGNYPRVTVAKDGTVTVLKIPCVRYEGTWEVRDVASGETETFCGAGDGDNEVWSANSAQTVAKKQGLLDYFETSWPQPTDFGKLIKQALEALPDEQLAETVRDMMPDRILTSKGAVQEILDFFGKTS